MMIPDVVRQMIRNEDGMELLGNCLGSVKILQETGRAKVDAVVLAQEGTDEPGFCSQLLFAYPDILIMGVTSDMA
ncbi:MAG: hypothetical protein CV088_05300 [Nitrospira sp. LK70]|nr:hypothetical protein [Nitrospira sp. LK70]